MFKKKLLNPSPLQVEKYEQIFYLTYLKPGMTAFDIGGNIGEITMLFSHFVGTEGVVHTFEAAPATFIKLEKIVELSGMNNIVLNNLAVSNETGMKSFNIYPEEYSGWNTFADRPLEKYGINLKPVEKKMIQTETIDHYCKEKKIDKIDLLKIDVEGAEMNVLLGAEKMFAEKRITCCVFEYGQTIYDMGNSKEEIIKFFNEVGYMIKNICPGSDSFPHNLSNGYAEYSVHFAKIK